MYGGVEVSVAALSRLGRRSGTALLAQLQLREDQQTQLRLERLRERQAHRAEGALERTMTGWRYKSEFATEFLRNALSRVYPHASVALATLGLSLPPEDDITITLTHPRLLGPDTLAAVSPLRPTEIRVAMERIDDVGAVRGLPIAQVSEDTLAHELGHVAVLTDGQIAPKRNARPGSKQDRMLNEGVGEFVKGEVRGQLGGPARFAPDSMYRAGLIFVSDRAAISPNVAAEVRFLLQNPHVGPQEDVHGAWETSPAWGLRVGSIPGLIPAELSGSRILGYVSTTPIRELGPVGCRLPAAVDLAKIRAPLAPSAPIAAKTMVPHGQR